jgi:translation initiation factor IF-3
MRDRTRINQYIREREVRVIDANEQHLGVLPVREALARAEEAGLDLVEVATKSRPHVCRIMDYGQYKYEQAKRAKEAKKKQKQVVVKEIKLRPRTDTHDYEFKLRHAVEFLEEGNKVKVIMIFRGRENAHRDIGRRKIDRMTEDLSQHGEPDFEPRIEGRTMVITYSPRPEAIKKKAPKETKRAEAENAQRSRKAVQADGDGQGQALEERQGTHSDQEDQEAETQSAEVHPG